MSESRALSGFDTISYRNNDIQAEKFNGLIRIGKVQKMHIAFFIKFILCKDIAYVLRNDTPVSAK